MVPSIGKWCDGGLRREKDKWGRLTNIEMSAPQNKLSRRPCLRFQTTLVSRLAEDINSRISACNSSAHFWRDFLRNFPMLPRWESGTSQIPDGWVACITTW